MIRGLDDSDNQIIVKFQRCSTCFLVQPRSTPQKKESREPAPQNAFVSIGWSTLYFVQPLCLSGLRVTKTKRMLHGFPFPERHALLLGDSNTKSPSAGLVVYGSLAL